jgi:hypothetical protein
LSKKVVAVCQPAPVSYCLCVVDNWSKWHTLLVDYGDQYILGIFSSVGYKYQYCSLVIFPSAQPCTSWSDPSSASRMLFGHSALLFFYSFFSMTTVGFALSVGNIIIVFSFCRSLMLFVLELWSISERPRCLLVGPFALVAGSTSPALPLPQTPRSVLCQALPRN